MQINLLAFGIAKDIIGGTQVSIDTQPNITVAQLKDHLHIHFPAFDQLVSLAIAVNGEYADDNHALKDKDEVVLIPPVSGG